MKKFIAILLCVIMLLACASCSKVQEAAEGLLDDALDSVGDALSDVEDAVGDALGDVEDGLAGITSDGDSDVELTLSAAELAIGDTLTITVKADDLDFDASPWVGIAPAGEYANEGELDDADLWYGYIVEKEQTCDIWMEEGFLEAGKYIVAVAESDGDGESAVLAKAAFTLKGGNGESGEDDGETAEAPTDRDSCAELYGTSICPFYITAGGEEYKYYFRGGGELTDWLLTEENVDGWYLYDGYVISADGKYAIPTADGVESFSSFCEYAAEKYSGDTLDEADRAKLEPGLLYVANSYTPIVTNWGLFLCADSESEEVVRACRGIASDFGVGEDIAVFIGIIDGEFENTASLYVLPHSEERYTGMLTDEMNDASVFSAALPLNSEIDRKAVFSVDEAGAYDLVFVFDGIIACWTVIDIA